MPHLLPGAGGAACLGRAKATSAARGQRRWRWGDRSPRLGELLPNAHGPCEPIPRLQQLHHHILVEVATRERLIAEDARSAEVIKPFLAGREIKRYQPPIIQNYILQVLMLK